MQFLIQPDNAWPLWGIVLAGVAGCIHLEQTYRWGARLSGPVLAIIAGMVLSNLKLMPVESPSYDLIEGYLVPAAIPLLLFRVNVVRIVRESGAMFRCFHIATLGSLIGSFLAAFLFRTSFERVPEVAGIMAASYIGGSVNFVAVQNHYGIGSALANPLMVADNFIMAAAFGLLFLLAGSRFMRRHFPHPHSSDSDVVESQALAAQHWQRKGIALADIAKALAIAFAITAISVKLAALIQQRVTITALQAILGSKYLLITILTVAVTTLFHRSLERINGAEEFGIYFLYLFFFVLGLRADLLQVVLNVPVLFAFCTVIAGVNIVVTLVLGKVFRQNLEELLLAINGTLGGPPSAVAMAIAMGWPRLVLPGLLAGLWGYLIGTFLGIAVAEGARRLWP